MASEATITLIEGARMEAKIGDHDLAIDLPERLGGKDTAPTSTELFAVSLAACKLFYAYRFLSRHGVETDGATAACEWVLGRKAVETLGVKVTMPGGLSEALAEGARRAMAQCVVQQSIDLPVDVTYSIE